MKNETKKQQIVFVEPFPEVMIYKLARAFKKRGYETVSVRLLEFDEKSESFYRDAFDKIIPFDLSFVKLNIKNIPNILLSLAKITPRIIKNYFKMLSLKPKIVISRATPSLSTYILKKFFPSWKIIYFPYDIRGLTYPDKESAKEAGLSSLEIRAERFCFENCAGIMHKGHPDELKYLNGRMLSNNIKFAPILSFLPYCSKEFSIPLKKNKKLGKEIHLVYIGSMGATTDGTNYLFEHFKNIIKQKMHIHVYMKSNTLSINKGFEKMSSAAKELSNSRYFHVHKSLNPREIIKEISKYDFGIWLSDNLSKINKKSLEPQFATGNKFTSYLEAGIPFIYSREFEFMDNLMKKYKLNLTGIKDIIEINKIIKKVDYSFLLKNVDKTRKDLDLDKHFPRLESFIQSISIKK